MATNILVVLLILGPLALAAATTAGAVYPLRLIAETDSQRGSVRAWMRSTRKESLFIAAMMLGGLFVCYVTMAAWGDTSFIPFVENGEASSIGIIGGTDGPMSLFVAPTLTAVFMSMLIPCILAVAAWSTALLRNRSIKRIRWRLCVLWLLNLIICAPLILAREIGWLIACALPLAQPWLALLIFEKRGDGA